MHDSNTKEADYPKREVWKPKLTTLSQLPNNRLTENNFAVIKKILKKGFLIKVRPEKTRSKIDASIKPPLHVETFS